MAQRKKITVTEALIGLSKKISAKTDLLSLLRLIKDLTVELIDADRASIFILDRTTRELWTVLADGETVIRVPEGKGIVGEVIKKNRLLNVPDVATDKNFYPLIDEKTGYETRNILCVPLVNRNGDAFGAIEVLNKNEGLFTKKDEELISVLGTQAGLSIENVEMNNDIRRNCVQLKLLLDIQKDINPSMDMEQVFEVILSNLLEAMNGVCGMFQLETKSGTVSNYSYHTRYGQRYWEEVDRRKCPGYMQTLLQKANCYKNDENKQDFFHAPGIVWARLQRDRCPIGYIAIQNNEEQKTYATLVSYDYIRVIAEQTVSFLAMRDVLEEKRRSEKQALIGTMLSSIVHDMRNPLSGISGFVQLIRRKSDEHKIQSYCDIILDRLGYIEKMNSELLLFVRGKSIELEKTAIVLKKYFEDLLVGFKSSFSNSSITIEFECSERIEIQADFDRLTRVFTNILNNAREAIQTEGIIGIELTRKDNCAIIKISDSGNGMPAHVQEKIFQPFVTFGKKGGTGLGMAIAKNIIDKHNGTIEIDSKLGKGTTFIINLPIE
ncbi:MAG: GAF domain-containing protein [Chitinivibrionales bacterium]|nr:GAF domain-containing protein [Chitinivibrionales bacterium]